MASLYYHVGDRVKIIGDHRKGCRGTIVAYDEVDGASVQLDGDAKNKPVDFAPYEIAPYNVLRVGDRVEVLKGLRKGHEAFVTSMDTYGVVVKFSDSKTEHYSVSSVQPIKLTLDVASGIASTVSEASPLPTRRGRTKIDMTKEYVSSDGREKPKKVKYLKSVPELMAEQNFAFSVDGSFVSPDNSLIICSNYLFLLGMKIREDHNHWLYRIPSLVKEI